jgi:DedD protein
MGLLSFLKRSKDEAPRRAAEPAGGRVASPDDLQGARTRARRRLIGASALLALGVVGFPLLFETQPRPLPVDIPIEIPSKDQAAPAPLPPKRAAAVVAREVPPVITERAEDAGRPVTAAASAAPVTAAASPAKADPAATVARPAPADALASVAPKVAQTAQAAKVEARPQARPEAKPEARAEAQPGAKSEAKPDAKVEAKTEAKPEPKVDDTKPGKDEVGRFVVQVGAFADEAGARQARQKLQAMGLKTYTQEVEVKGAKRIRVRAGPFATRDAAAKVAARLKAAGLPGDLLAL